MKLAYRSTVLLSLLKLCQVTIFNSLDRRFKQSATNIMSAILYVDHLTLSSVKAENNGMGTTSDSLDVIGDSSVALVAIHALPPSFES